MKKINSILALLFSYYALFFSASVKAQISYRDNLINIGGATENGKFNFLINGFSGLSWTFDSGNKFFQCDVTAASPRLSGTKNEVVFYNSFNKTFNNIQVAEVFCYSDARAKTNIKSLRNSLSAVLNLRPVSYNWKNEAINSASTSNGISSIAYGSDDNKTKIGFLAQEVEEILPEAVMTDEEGRKLINYTSIIPVLVQSIQELQSQLNEQALIIMNLSEAKNNGSDLSRDGMILSCNVNQMSKKLTISYLVESTFAEAEVLICNLMGNLESKIECEVNQNLISHDISLLKPGIYIATLVIDGVVKDSKQFVKE